MQTSGHSHRPRREDSTCDLERVATEWFFQRDRGFAAGEGEAFHRWLQEDDRHSRAFAEIESTWRSLGEANSKVVGAGFDLHLPVDSQVGRKLPDHSNTPVTAARFTRRERKRIWFPAALTAAAGIAIACVVWWRPNSAGAVFAEQAATEIGGLRKIDLPDGSFVTLNSNSAVDVQFTPGARRVRLLRGEANFAVVQSPCRPFVVEANAVVVKAVGTAFNVRLRPEMVEVLVTDGRVRVDDAAHGDSLLSPSRSTNRSLVGERDRDALLVAGERVEIPVTADAVPTPAIPTAIRASQIDEALAWQKRRLEYVDAPLSEIVADFNRYNQHRLVIADGRLAARRFGGSFSAGDYSSLVQLLEKTFGVVVERHARETILRLP